MPTADELLSRETVQDLIAVLRRAAPGRPLPALEAVEGDLDDLAFGERVAAVRDGVLADLPEDHGAFDALLRVALDDPAFRGWMIWAVADAVAVRSVAAWEAGDDGAFDAGLALLAALTPRHTAEAAIRRFLRADLDRTLAIVRTWTDDPDPHVRRFATEGTRPRLPWALRVPALTDRPDATIPILDALYRDDEEYVRRSVANHLNDVSRARPELAVDTAARWLASPIETTPRVVRHALRTLIKQGDPGALELLGFGPVAGLVVAGPRLSAGTVRIGETLDFAAELENGGDVPVRLAVDYVVHYQKANGTLAPKVFKLTTRTLAPGERLAVVRTHAFRPLTTRRHHAGDHALELQVNGQRYGRVAFRVDPEAPPAG